VESDVVEGRATVELGDWLTSRIRVVVTKAVSTQSFGEGGVGISEAKIAGVSAARTLVVPEGPKTGEAASVVLSAASSIGSCFFTETATRCNPALARGSEDAGRLDRTVTLPAAASYEPALWVKPRAGAALDELIDRELAASALDVIPPIVSASSRAVADPGGRAGAVVDGDAGTAWYAGDGDASPWLSLRWPVPRTITGLHFHLDPEVAGTRPAEITVVGADGTRSGVLDDTGTLVFDRPMTTAELTVFFVARASLRSLNPYPNSWQSLPLAACVARCHLFACIFAC
jgi:arabinofuranan 3-O-arabinosyltransferase